MKVDSVGEAGAAGWLRVPVSTYRLQFHCGLGFADARALVAYLVRLGVTDCYASPYLKASPGSTHGYDICDHNRLNPEVGSDAEHAAFSAELAAHGMILRLIETGRVSGLRLDERLQAADR